MGDGLLNDLQGLGRRKEVQVEAGEESGDSPDEVGLYAEAAYWGFPAGFAHTFCNETSEVMDVPGLGSVELAMFRSPIEAGNIQFKSR